MSVVIYVIGSKGEDKYTQALQEYQEAAQQVAECERQPLYPNKTNLDSKRIAIGNYRQSVQSLQQAFEAYRTRPLENISPQAFSDALKQANKETLAAFNGKTRTPKEYFCGFEAYKTSVAPGKSPRVLAYQLNTVKALMLQLAASGATELINVYRPPLDEEQGAVYQSKEGELTRSLPIEITFTGREQAVRTFLSSVAAADERYLVIRTVRILNSRQTPPKTTDAKFEHSSVKSATDSGSQASPFAELFAPPTATPPAATPPAGTPPAGTPPAGTPPAGTPPAGTPPAGTPPAGTPPAGTPPAAPEVKVEEAAPSDSSRILSQVLGDEELQVFLRIDLMQFLPVKDLP
jgi:hypothetical protein